MPHPVLNPVAEANLPRHEIQTTLTILAAELGPEAVVELLQIFLEDTPQRIGELQHLAGGADQVTLRRVAHSLKSTAALFGALPLEEASAGLERSAAQGQVEGQSAQTETIRWIYDDLRPMIEGVLKEMSAL
jgi:HPt (histidine-containing phosphotransfer) domain-containing protein